MIALETKIQLGDWNAYVKEFDKGIRFIQTHLPRSVPVYFGASAEEVMVC